MPTIAILFCDISLKTEGTLVPSTSAWLVKRHNSSFVNYYSGFDSSTELKGKREWLSAVSPFIGVSRYDLPRSIPGCIELRCIVPLPATHFKNMYKYLSKKLSSLLLSLSLSSLSLLFLCAGRPIGRVTSFRS